MKKTITFLLLTLFTTVLSAQTVNIQGNPYSGNPYPTISDAITAATDGDVILISGVHTESISISKSITLRGTNPLTDIIQADAAPATALTRVITLTGAPSALNITIENLGIKNGNASGTGNLGGGINIDKITGLVTLKNLIIEDNKTTINGGAIGIAGSNVDIIECTIKNNFATLDGGAIIAAPNNNSGNGIDSVINIKQSLIDSNTGANGGGIYINGNKTFGNNYKIAVNIENSTISNNTANSLSSATGGGAIWSKTALWTTTAGGDGVSGNVTLSLVHATLYNNSHANSLIKNGINFTVDGGGKTNFSAYNSIIVNADDLTQKVALNFASTNTTNIVNCIFGRIDGTVPAAITDGAKNNLSGKTATFAGLSGTLSSEGGNTQVLQITSASTAENYCTASTSPATIPIIDQRGYLRTGTYDAGAYELAGIYGSKWTGATNTVWETDTNWINGVPNSASNVIIPSASNQPSIASNITINSLDIASGVTLTVNEAKVLDVSGSITNSGDLILKSSTTGTASLLNTSAVPNVTQQRYLSSNQHGWRLLSNPLASTTFNALATASNITIGTNYTGEYLSATNTWTSTDGSASMDNQKAYKLFITGLIGESPTYTSGPSNVTLVNKGTAANTAPAAIVATNGEFYLIANPYTAPISLKTILDANAFLSKTVSYFDPTVGSSGNSADLKVKFGGYTAKNTSTSATPGDANDLVLPPMGAIFVQASSTGSITVPKTAIFTGTNNSGTYTHKTAQTKVASTNALKIEVNSSGVYYDALALQFKSVGDGESNIDFGKLPNSILDAYSFAGSNKMAVSELELADQTIQLGITSTIQKNYTFKVVDNTIPAGYEAVLVDNVLNTTTILTSGTNYNFAIDSNPASQGDARFAINLKTAGSLGVIANELDASIQVYPNPSRGQFNITNALNQKEDAAIEISNLNGQVIHTLKLNSGTTTIQTKSWATGVYILKATNNGTQTTKKLIIQ